jgi:uncharacterized protein YuzE
METKLVFKYDREGDILYINKRPPYPEQNSEELGDEVIARLNPKTGEIENLEVLFFSTRLLRNDMFELPISADLREACAEALRAKPSDRSLKALAELERGVSLRQALVCKHRR